MTVVYSHGNAEDLRGMIDIGADICQRLNVNLTHFFSAPSPTDCVGESDCYDYLDTVTGSGSPSESNCYNNLYGVLQYLGNRVCARTKLPVRRVLLLLSLRCWLIAHMRLFSWFGDVIMHLVPVFLCQRVLTQVVVVVLVFRFRYGRSLGTGVTAHVAAFPPRVPFAGGTCCVPV